MTLAGRIREKKLTPGVTRFLNDVLADPQCREDTQLALWNSEWSRIQTEIPFYAELVRTGQAPARFSSWSEFIDRVPPATRAEVQGHTKERSCTSRPADFTRLTGGSTSEPIRLPAWQSEQATMGLLFWAGKQVYGITPGSRAFYLWGHSHLLGKGLRGFLNGRKRKLQDRLLGYHRFSAYDLSPDAMSRAGDALVRFRPDYMIGYSVALDRFARINAARARDFRGLKLRAVIATAESFPDANSKARLTDLFECPVVMEYGSIETGVIAYAPPPGDGGYNVFWRSYFLEFGPITPESGGRPIRVTSLYPRCFPLVRYEIGDEAVLGDTMDDVLLPVSPIYHFETVMGRCNDYVNIGGKRIHSEVFSHAVRDVPEISGFQVIQNDRSITLNLLAPPGTGTISKARLEALTDTIKAKLSKANPVLAPVAVQFVESLRQTGAGKSRMVITEKGS